MLHRPTLTIHSWSVFLAVVLDATHTQQTGGYPNPPAIKRQYRDPYADWWDKQERRNFGEVVHEDNDILGVFSPEDYTHFTAAWGVVLWGCFLASGAVLMAAVYQYYPDTPTVPRTFPGGLEKELGGSNTVVVSGKKQLGRSLSKANRYMCRH